MNPDKPAWQRGFTEIWAAAPRATIRRGRGETQHREQAPSCSQPLEKGSFGGRNGGLGRIPACRKHGEGGREGPGTILHLENSSGVSGHKLGVSWLCLGTGAVTLWGGGRELTPWQPSLLSQAGAGLSVLPFTLQTGAAAGLGETARLGQGLDNLGGSARVVTKRGH